MSADNLCHQPVFVDDATYAVVAPDPEMIQVGDAVTDLTTVRIQRRRILRGLINEYQRAA